MDDAGTLLALEAAESFACRHIGPDGLDIAAMLLVVGEAWLAWLASLAARMVPHEIRTAAGLDLPPPIDEAAMLAELGGPAARNDAATESLLGCGYYGPHTPPVTQRIVLKKPGWYTAYPPYQPRIAQGRLEALLNFQTVGAGGVKEGVLS